MYNLVLLKYILFLNFFKIFFKELIEMGLRILETN